jgi:alkanesulfonate monooxygenase SsuD/methylene tetrahydromethanopterin reductase-like flavin-dependent oxidoreductase (luciferase family)
LAIIQQAWGEGRVDFHGEFYQYDDLAFRPPPVQSPVPTYVASVSPETFDMVREWGYGIMGSLLTNSVQQLGPRLTEYRESLPEAVRSTKPIPIMTPVYVADTMEDAFKESLPEFTWYWQTVGKLLPAKGEVLDQSYSYFQKLGERTGGDADVAGAMARWPVGDADHVTEYLVELCRRTTADEIICFASIGAMPWSKASANLERIASEVMPRVRAALAEDRAREAQPA